MTFAAVSITTYPGRGEAVKAGQGKAPRCPSLSYPVAFLSMTGTEHGANQKNLAELGIMNYTPPVRSKRETLGKPFQSIS